MVWVAVQYLTASLWLKVLYRKHIATDASNWAKDDLAKAKEAGITAGERLQDVVTCEEAVVMVLRGMK